MPHPLRALALPSLFAALLIPLVMLGACTPDARDAPADAEPPSEGPAAPAPGEPSPEGGLTTEEARAVLLTVYEPIAAFYERVSGGADEPALPSDLSTPDAVRALLTQTMSADVANRFIDQLLMQRDGTWTLRPTELILHPQMNTPVLDQIDVEERGGDTFALVEHYAASELYGSGRRTSVVRYQDGAWQLLRIE